ncbi:TetR/AcrR family transcriptional regulator [Conexibacter sp. CPCC 206217]|uniref:TetR/AcrR family transcriptional regulator n=1 Tax=Conexibacter sp. CPCC 206217 TaxID=3064574 RepID=UPI00271DA3DA|nr:TetR/AcrR family transcriptional regulator [Conexibacter sp. CPCC 206217]MDO8214200.1 TetR/AcrR family transcriptional regulator [Conexibacter sp. CPCC 206217]
MTRLPRNRRTHLTPEEIAAEVLRQFDAGATAPSIRHLARALDVAPSAIYHHYPSRAAIYTAGVDLVWQEATAALLAEIADPFTADPVEVLVTAGLVTRQAFLRHYRIAPYVAASHATTGLLANVLALIASVMERLGLEDEAATACFHTYASLTLGSVTFAANRLIANDELEFNTTGARFRSTPDAEDASHSSEPMRRAVDAVIDLSTVDPARDEELFATGLRRLIESFGLAVSADPPSADAAAPGTPPPAPRAH